MTILRQPETALKHFRDVIDLVTDTSEQEAPLLTAHAMSILAAAIEQAHTSVADRIHETSDDRSPESLVGEAQRIIWKHSHQKVSVERIAKQLMIARRTLERHFRDHLGRTVLQEVVACRIQRAKRLLGETHVPIRYVAYAAGFSSISNLCKVFRRETGITPGDYRDTVFKAGESKNSSWENPLNHGNGDAKENRLKR